MSQPLRYLSPHALLEPLVARWPAWWMTVAPIPSALHARRYQLPLLQNYLKAPAFHAKASRDRRMSGGAFIAVDPARAPEVGELLRQTQEEGSELLALAEAYEGLEALVLAEAKGGSPLSLYGRAPESLQGLFEIVYDYRNRPSIRLLEPLTYATKAYRRQAQSVAWSLLEEDPTRPSWLNTPRLPVRDGLELSLPFDDGRLDWLYRLDLQGAPLEAIQDALGLPASAKGALEALTTGEAPAPFEPWAGPGMRIRYLGHATALVEWAGVSVLIDPVISPLPTRPGAPRPTFRELPPRIDFVLITHAHADHFSLESLLRLRHRIGTLVVPQASGALVGDVSLAVLARRLGFRDVVELGALGRIPLGPTAEVVAVPFLGEHGDVAHAKTAWVLRDGDHRALFAADSAALDVALYRRLRDALGPLQTVFMNTETEGSPLTFSVEALFPKERDRQLEKDRLCRGSTAAEGLRLLEAVGAKRVFNYAMGLEPWLEYITGFVDPTSNRMKDSDALLDGAKARGLRAERLNGPTAITIASTGD